MNFGEKIKKLRLDRDWNQEYVASKLNISVPALSRYESGTYEPKSLEIISDFAKLYNVTTDYLLGLDLDYEADKKNSIPVLGVVKAGYDYLANENIIGYLEPTPEIKDPENYFGLVVKGDSMTPLFLEGDYLLVHKQDGEYNSHDACIILINGNEATVKNIVKTDDGIELHPFNPCYPIKKYTFEEIKDLPIVILGKVVKLIRNLK